MPSLPSSPLEHWRVCGGDSLAALGGELSSGELGGHELCELVHTWAEGWLVVVGGHELGGLGVCGARLRLSEEAKTSEANSLVRSRFLSGHHISTEGEAASTAAEKSVGQKKASRG